VAVTFKLSQNSDGSFDGAASKFLREVASQASLLSTEGSFVSCFVGFSANALNLLGASESLMGKVVPLDDIYAAGDLEQPDLVVPKPGAVPVLPDTRDDIGAFLKGQSKDACLKALETLILQSLRGIPGCDNSILEERLNSQDSVEFEETTTLGTISITFCNQVYGGGKDLTGFVDGTVNPDKTLRESVAMALRKDGSSHAYFSKFVHNLDYFRSLSRDQKSDHVARMYGIEQPSLGRDGRTENPRLMPPRLNGRAHIIRGWGSMLRHAMPYHNGACPAHPSVDAEGTYDGRGPSGPRLGLYFVATAAEPDEITEALKRMCGHYATGPFDGGLYSVDDIFKITRSVSGSYLYVPSLAELSDLSGAENPQAKNKSHAIISLLPDELKDLREVPSRKQPGQVRVVDYGYCDNCGSEQSFMRDEGGNLRICHLCNRVTYIE
jgi:hypothetical protein